jgi:RNA polymerase sigma factor (sigma-70 family)
VVAAISLSDSVSFEDYFLAEYPRVVAAAYRVLGERDDAEDVAQELFARIAHRRNDLPSPALLYVTAVRRALNLLRSRRRRAEREARVHRLTAPLQQALQEGGDPAAALDQRQRQMLVRAALIHLPPRDAELLVLRHEGCSYRELAQLLHLDAAQIGTRLARAHNAFKREIDRALQR